MAELSTVPEPLAPVNCNNFSIDVTGEIGNKECCEVGEFLVVTHTLEGDSFCGIEFLHEVSW